MYGTEVGAASTGGGAVLAMTGVSTGSYVLAAVAVMLLLSGSVMLFVNRRRRGGARP